MHSWDHEIHKATVGRSFIHELTSRGENLHFGSVGKSPIGIFTGVTARIHRGAISGVWNVGKTPGNWECQLIMPTSGGAEKAQGCNSCGEDSGKWLCWIHLVSKDSHFSQRMHLTGLIQQSMSSERQMCLPSTLPRCPSIKNTQNNVRILKHSLEVLKCRKTSHCKMSIQ